MSAGEQRRASLEAAVALGLTADEYAHIRSIQGGEPTYVELAIYSLMWSEHCSYKHSRPILGRFPTSGPRILQGPGENAGIIDVGDGWAVAMKVESHNHPSAVEPFQGAATGVGGIVRDIFTMGARPCVSLDSLRFGEIDGPENARQRFLFDGVVGGIGFYGNCLGIPTVGGEIYFEKSYEGNCLVNAMSAGLLRADQIVRAIASGPGNHVVLIGSRTGRDGIGGASVLASQEFDETLEEKRPSVQVGDPFTEKKLIEACLELLHRKLVVSMQDLGAAGLTSSSSEMASKGHVGLDIHADRVPLREADMEPWEIMISESQERMLSIVDPARLTDVREVCERWDLDCTVIGEVTDSKMLRIYWHGERVADIPARRLADESPVIRTPSFRPAYLVDEPLAVTRRRSTRRRPTAPPPCSSCWRAPNIASKRCAYEQYDYIVQANTVQIPGSDAAVLRIKGTLARHRLRQRLQRAPLLPRPVPRRQGRGRRSGAQPELRRRAAGGRHRLPQLRQPRKGRHLLDLRAGRRGHGASLRGARHAGRVGQRELLQRELRQRHLPHADGRHAGRLRRRRQALRRRASRAPATSSCLLGPPANAWLDGSEYQKVHYGRVEGRVPDVDLELEKQLQRVLREGIAAGLIKSAHDCAEGGLAVALAECCIASGVEGGALTAAPPPFLGAALALPASALRPDVALFGEGPSRVVVTCAPDAADALAEPGRRTAAYGPGHGRRRPAADRSSGGSATIDLPVAELHRAYESLPQRLA